MNVLSDGPKFYAKEIQSGFCFPLYHKKVLEVYIPFNSLRIPFPKII